MKTRSITAALLAAGALLAPAQPLHASAPAKASACIFRPAGARVPGPVLTGGMMSGLVADSATGHVFLATQSNGDPALRPCIPGIAMLDGWNGRISGFAAMGAASRIMSLGGMAIHQAAHRLLAVDSGLKPSGSRGPGSVLFLDTRTGRAISRTQVGASPRDIAIDQHTYRAFVPENESEVQPESDVAVLAITRGTLLRTVHVPQTVDAALGDSRSDRVFLIGSAAVTTLDGRTGDIVNTVALPSGYYTVQGYGVDEGTGRLFVLSRGLAPPHSNLNGNPPSVISVIDAADGSLVASVTESAAIRVGGALIVDPHAGIVISTQSNTDSTQATILDARTAAVRRTVKLGLPPGGFSGAIAVDPVTGRIYGYTSRGIRVLAPGSWRSTAVAGSTWPFGQSLIVNPRTHRLFAIELKAGSTLRVYCTRSRCR